MIILSIAGAALRFRWSSHRHAAFRARSPAWCSSASRNGNHEALAAVFCDAKERQGPNRAWQNKKIRRSRRLRLDEVLKEKFPGEELKTLQSYVLQGKVVVNGRKVEKIGEQVLRDANVELLAKASKFVSRAGLKLEGALDHFGISVEGKIALDCGISTGGFTDCLLQRGARLVYGVDVGYGDVAFQLRQHPSVVLMERTNMRQIDPEVFKQKVDIATLDVSFISVLKILPAVFSILQPNGEIVVLIKPQFECRKEQVEDGGVVTDPAVHTEVIQNVISGVEKHGIHCIGWIESPIQGALAKNKEFLAFFSYDGVDAQKKSSQ